MAIEARTIRRGLALILVGYWLALFVATHLPRIPASLELPGSDKWHHFAAYAGLSFLLAAWRAVGRHLTWSMALGVVGLVALYGLVDEISQIPVGRDAEVADWFADLVGAMIGVTAFQILRILFSRLFGREKD